jgi:vacuolar-type H+-ATPase subunit H
MNSIVKTLIAIDKEASARLDTASSAQAKTLEQAHEEANEIYRTYMKEADMKISAMKEKYKKKFDEENAARASAYDAEIAEMKNLFDTKKDDIIVQIVNSIIGA